MKIQKSFKNALYLDLTLLFFSGLFYFIFQNWFLRDNGFGPAPLFSTIWILRIHSVVSLFFLIQFGYLLHAHVRPGLRIKRKVKSGYALLGVITLLVITVPGLFYITDDAVKLSVALIHTYVGILAGFAFLAHWLTRP